MQRVDPPIPIRLPGEQDLGAIVMDYRLEPSDLADFYFAASRKHSSFFQAHQRLRAAGRWLIGFALLTGSICLIILLDGSARDYLPLWAALGFTLGLTILLTALWALLARSRSRRGVEESTKMVCRQPPGRSAMMPCRLICSGVGVRSISDDRDVSMSWQAVTSVTDFDNCISIDRCDGTAYIIPKNLFPEQGRARKVLETLRAWMLAAPGSDGRRAVELAARGGLACPRCSHDLRGIRDPICPECGLLLNRYTLQALMPVELIPSL